MKKLAINRRARADYQIKKEFEAGIVLTGNEVKSVKKGQISLKEAFVRITPQEEAFLLNAHIAPYQKGTAGDPKRSRKMLLKKKELKSLLGKTQQGLAIVPLSCYLKRGLIKLRIGLGKRKKKGDRREELKQRAQERDISQELKTNA